MSKETFWAWLAGFIDGEAYFVLVKNPNKKYKSGYQWIPQIVVTQKDTNLLQYIKKKVGYGWIYKPKSGKTPIIVFKQKKARLILPNILPYLRVKKEKAELLYEACLIIKDGNKWGGRGRPEWEFNKLDELSNRIKEAKNGIQDLDKL